MLVEVHKEFQGKLNIPKRFCQRSGAKDDSMKLGLGHHKDEPWNLGFLHNLSERKCHGQESNCHVEVFPEDLHENLQEHQEMEFEHYSDYSERKSLNLDENIKVITN